MRVMVLGLRGFPGIQGGVETHAEHLYPRLRDLGCSVEVIVRTPYWHERSADEVPGIRFRPLWCPSASGAEAFVHSFLGVLYAGLRRPDVLHIHAIGPAVFTPLAKLLGLRVVVTHHGPDYDREKWSRVAKAILRAGERFGMLFSDARIVISHVIGSLVKSKYGRESFCIPNGVEIPGDAPPGATLHSLGLEPSRYLITVSRMVPEKRHLDMIDAFQKAHLDGWKLALVGRLDLDDVYCQQVMEAANQTPDVVLAGFRTGQALAELYANAGGFVLASTHEGLPIALLEALSFGLPCVASNIPANLEVGLPPEQYFTVGDIDSLSIRLRQLTADVRSDHYRSDLRRWVQSKYDWNRIARSTLEVYHRVKKRRWHERIVTTLPPE